MNSFGAGYRYFPAVEEWLPQTIDASTGELNPAKSGRLLAQSHGNARRDDCLGLREQRGHVEVQALFGIINSLIVDLRGIHDGDTSRLTMDDQARVDVPQPLQLFGGHPRGDQNMNLIHFVLFLSVRPGTL